MLRARAGTTKVQIRVNVLPEGKSVSPKCCCTPVLCLWDGAAGSGGWQGPAGHSRVQGTPHSPVCTIPEGCPRPLQHRPKALNLISVLPGVGLMAEGPAGLSLYQQDVGLIDDCPALPKSHHFSEFLPYKGRANPEVLAFPLFLSCFRNKMFSHSSGKSFLENLE